jgi:uncharacterized protein YxjI
MAGTQFTIRKKIISFLGQKFHIYKEDGTLLGFCKQKAFKLKEDIRIFTDETMSEERVVIKARSMMDISAAYEVTDSQSGQLLGVLQRRGMKSILRDEWTVFDENESEIGSLKEDSMALALVRRLLFNLIPQKFHLRDSAGTELAELRSNFNPFVSKLTVTVYPDCPLKPFLVLSAGLLLVAIEGKQK